MNSVANIGADILQGSNHKLAAGLIDHDPTSLMVSFHDKTTEEIQSRISKWLQLRKQLL